MSSKKTRILHLIKSLGRGGAEKLIPETAALHDQQRFEFFCLYFYQQPHNLVDELQMAGVRVDYLPSGNLGLFLQVHKVREYVKKQGIAIIHCHLPWAGVLGRIAGSKLGVPVIYTEHNIWERYNRISYWMNRWTFHLQDTIVVVSDGVKQSVTNNLPPNHPALLRIRTVCNAVNTDVFQRNDLQRKRVRENLGISQETLVIGTVAVFRAQKRLPLWIQVARKIWDSHPETHFVLLGNGQEMEKVIRETGNGSFSRHVHLLGTQKDVVPYLSAMDMYLGTSAFEGLPVAMLEGMACGLPVLSTRAGGIGEVIREGVEGFLCDLDEPWDLVAKAGDLIKDETLRVRMSQAARSRVLYHFSMPRMVSELEDIYDEVLVKGEMSPSER